MFLICFLEVSPDRRFGGFSEFFAASRKSLFCRAMAITRLAADPRGSAVRSPTRAGGRRERGRSGGREWGTHVHAWLKPPSPPEPETPQTYTFGAGNAAVAGVLEGFSRIAMPCYCSLKASLFLALGRLSLFLSLWIPFRQRNAKNK